MKLAGEREQASAWGRDARERVGPSWAGSFAGPRGEREKGLGWVGFGLGFGLGFLFFLSLFYFYFKQSLNSN